MCLGERNYSEFWVDWMALLFYIFRGFLIRNFIIKINAKSHTTNHNFSLPKTHGINSFIFSQSLCKKLKQFIYFPFLNQQRK
jgi:hypothetical protein